MRKIFFAVIAVVAFFGVIHSVNNPHLWSIQKSVVQSTEKNYFIAQDIGGVPGPIFVTLLFLVVMIACLHQATKDTKNTTR